MDFEFQPIGKDVVNIYGFVFGRYRYQVEWFDHKKERESNPGMLVTFNYLDTIYGTKVYRFDDDRYEPHIETYLVFNLKLTEDMLKRMILVDAIYGREEDPYDVKDLFITDRNQSHFYSLFHRKKEYVKHNYPECSEPYDKCPICGHNFDEYDTFDTENSVDIFNYSKDGWVHWDEIHRCPYCDKLFFIRGEC